MRQKEVGVLGWLPSEDVNNYENALWNWGLLVVNHGENKEGGMGGGGGGGLCPVDENLIHIPCFLL